MKNLLRLIILTVITSFVISSCGKQMSITKRKYNKGYYVSHSHKKGDVKTQPATATVKHIPVEKNEPVILKTEPTPLPTTSDKDLSLTAAVAKPVETNATTVNKTDKSSGGNTFAKKFYKIKPLEKILPSQLYTKEVKEKLSRDDDALSLFWIIILVILILYLIGLAADDFGIGGAIHVLALIALILLILWLLRVI